MHTPLIYFHIKLVQSRLLKSSSKVKVSKAPYLNAKSCPKSVRMTRHHSTARPEGIVDWMCEVYGLLWQDAEGREEERDVLSVDTCPICWHCPAVCWEVPLPTAIRDACWRPRLKLQVAGKNCCCCWFLLTYVLYGHRLPYKHKQRPLSLWHTTHPFTLILRIPIYHHPFMPHR